MNFYIYIYVYIYVCVCVVYVFIILFNLEWRKCYLILNRKYSAIEQRKSFIPSFYFQKGFEVT